MFVPSGLLVLHYALLINKYSRTNKLSTGHQNVFISIEQIALFQMH